VTVKVYGSAVYPMQWMRMIMICCGMAVKRMGMLRMSVRKMKALTVKMETESVMLCALTISN
jgi:hypothetical protein